MPPELITILESLEKPLDFASRNNFSNLDKVVSLENLVEDLTLKALSLPLSDTEKKGIRDIRRSFSRYRALDSGRRKEIVLGSLDLVRKLKDGSPRGHTRSVKKDEKADSRKRTPDGPRKTRETDSSREAGDLTLTPLQFVKGVGPRISRIMEKKGVRTVHDALYYFPRRYEDRRTVKSISKLLPGERETLAGKIMISGEIRTRTRTLYQVVVSDGTGVINLIWFQFNARYLKTTYKKGLSVILTGDITVGYGNALQIVHPRPEDIEIVEESDDIDEDNVHFNRIVPVYPLTEGIGQRRMRRIMKSVVDGFARRIEDFLPGELKQSRNLADYTDSIARVHFPADNDSVTELSDSASVYNSLPHKTVSYGEFLLMEIGLALKKREITKLQGISFSPTGELTRGLLNGLGFELTGAQARVLGEIERDMRAEAPMNRLLEGDVGSGKTLVAVISMLKAVESGYQAVMMAPTEILAEQHLSTVMDLVRGMGLTVVFLKSGLSSRERNSYYKALESGEADIAVGTHALIQDRVNFKNLGLVVIDEQHRFGVMQRAELMNKGKNPDVLVMTATPIPRTLALTVYGDLDVSVIDQLPPGRKRIKTKVYYDRKGARESAYEVVRGEIEKGRQAYIVYPMIEESDNADFKDIKYATRMAGELQNETFSEFRVGLLHGKMKTDEKEAVMRRFIGHQIDILVATTVIEVGVDVPNATVMVVENAERFGLTQLHQLRGRVGRGGHGSHCVLISSYRRSQDADKRLQIMEDTSDGFRIAEADLLLRGPGDFLGTKQSGIPEFGFANLIRDRKILSEAREDAFSIVNGDPELKKNPGLMRAVWRKWGGLLDLAGIS